MNSVICSRSGVALAGLLVVVTACGDDGASDDRATGATGVASSSGDGGADTGPGADTTGSTTVSTTDAGTTDGTAGTADDTAGATEDEGSSSTGPAADNHWGALVLGTLFTDDLTEAQMTHDAVAMGGRRAAMAAGDYGHDALLGTTLLGTAENQFLGIDQWETLEGALGLYGDPKFQAAFGMLFARAPSVELFERREDWYGWGTLEAGDAGDHWYVVVRGRLDGDDLDASQAAHDMIAMGGEEAATALGDVAHVVWVGTPEDPQQFFAVDVWTDDAMIETFYENPDFQEAFGALFEAAPTVGVYGSTDWYQW